MTGFLDLPVELIQLICSYLPIKSRLCLEGVCRSLQAIVLHPSLYRCLDVSNSDLSDGNFRVLLQKTSTPFLKNVCLHHCFCISGTVFQDYSYMFASITSLNLTGTLIGNEDLRHVWTQASRHGVLKELQFMDCVALTRDVTNGLISKLHSLELLQLSSHLSVENIIHFVDLAPFLLTLDTDGIIIDVDGIASIIGSAKCLKALYAPYAVLTDYCLDELFYYLKHGHLKLLSIVGSSVTEAGVRFFKEIHRPMLCDLDILIQ